MSVDVSLSTFPLIFTEIMAKVALIVGAMPENSVLAGLAVKDAPHHVVVPDLVHTDILQADARYVANPSSMCLYVVANNQRDFSQKYCLACYRIHCLYRYKVHRRLRVTPRCAMAAWPTAAVSPCASRVAPEFLL